MKATEKQKERYRKHYHNNLEKQKSKARRTYQENRERYMEIQKQYRVNTRREVFTHYGNGKCACAKCNFGDMRALTIDHINGGGRREERETGRSGVGLYCYLRKNGYPEGYQTLCHNCQWIKRAERREYNQYGR